MTEKNSAILESWPSIKEDLRDFLSDMDAWIIAEIKKAHQDKDWDRLAKVIEVMDMVHNLSHSH